MVSQDRTPDGVPPDGVPPCATTRRASATGDGGTPLEFGADRDRGERGLGIGSGGSMPRVPLPKLLVAIASLRVLACIPEILGWTLGIWPDSRDFGWNPGSVGGAPRSAGWAPRSASRAPRSVGWAPRSASRAPRSAGWAPRSAGWAPGSADWAPGSAGWRPRHSEGAPETAMLPANRFEHGLRRLNAAA